jgi:uncharacterized membrane protein
MGRDLVITMCAATSGSFSLEAITSLSEEEQPLKAARLAIAKLPTV